MTPLQSQTLPVGVYVSWSRDWMVSEMGPQWSVVGWLETQEWGNTEADGIPYHWIWLDIFHCTRDKWKESEIQYKWSASVTLFVKVISLFSSRGLSRRKFAHSSSWFDSCYVIKLYAPTMSFDVGSASFRISPIATSSSSFSFSIKWSANVSLDNVHYLELEMVFILYLPHFLADKIMSSFQQIWLQLPWTRSSR